MTSPAPQTVAEPNTLQGGKKPASRVLWFVGGCATVLLVTFVLVVAVAIVALRSTSATPTEMARLLARPLVPEGTSEPIVSEAEMHAALSSRIAEARRLSGQSSELSSVAGEYA